MRRSRQRGGLDAWPGYVDALSTLLMVVIFVLLVFVLAQGFLSAALSSRDRALDRLNRQVAEISEMLALERGQAEELRGLLSRATDDLRALTGARDALSSQLAAAIGERERSGTEATALWAERDRLAARLADLDAARAGTARRLTGAESQIAEALARAEAAGADAARTVQRLGERDRELAAERDALSRERTARGAAEARVAEQTRAITAEREARAVAERAARESAGALETARLDLATLRRLQGEAAQQLAEAQRQIGALREAQAALDRTVRADRATIEARLSDIARLQGDIQRLTALREVAERAAQAAQARATEEAGRAREALARAEAEAGRARDATALSSADAARARDATARAAAEEQRRRAAEGSAAEQARLSDAARAQIALLTRQLEELRGQLNRVANALDATEARDRENEAQVVNLRSQLNTALAQRVEELQRYRSEFFGRLREVLGDRPELRVVGDRFIFQSEVLFPPASAELSAVGTAQIRQLSRVLLEIASRIPPEVPWLLRVDGHADRNPIRSSRFASNWELSAARAIAVANLLMEAGLPANRVAAAAFGEHQPLDNSESAEALARNRRIELRLTDR